MSRQGLLFSSCKKDLLDIYNHAIEAVKPDNLIKNAITIKTNRLVVKDHRNGHVANIDLGRSSSLHLIGGGKSVMGMASGIAQLANQAGVTDLFSLGCLSLPIGLRASYDDNVKLRDQLQSIGVKCLFGSKDNLPDESSVEASRSILDNIKIACDRDRAELREPLFIVVLSGGGSACLTSPKFIDLERKLHLIKFLVQKGASIVELNKVRRYFSNIKGGELARHILECHPKSRILTLILSDVIGDPVDYIASGPTYLSYNDSQRSSASEDIQRELMLGILEKYGYPREELPQSNKTTTCLPNTNDDEERVCNIVIGNNTVALNAAIMRAQLLNYRVKLISNKLEGFSEEVVDRIRAFGEQAFMATYDNDHSGVLVIGGGEVTIKKLDSESWGKGGRAQEMALDYMISRLTSSSEQDVALENSLDLFLAGGTDGQDGPTEVAGCLASVACFRHEEAHDNGTVDLEKFLAAKRDHNSYNFWTKCKPDWLIKTGLTGTNVMDLYMYLLCKEKKE